MSDTNPNPNTGQSDIKTDIQHLLDYVSNLSNLMADADRDEVYKFLTSEKNLESLQNFATEKKNSQHLFSNKRR